MKTAAFYGRYSCSSQTEQSIEGQLSVCSQYAKNNDIVIVDTYIDRAQTGTNDNRAEFQRMLKDSATASWDILLVYAIDRFGRNAIEVAINKQKLKTNESALKERIITDPFGSWTGVCDDDKFESPIQDADDL